MAAATRPTSAYLITIALAILGALDLGAALVHGGSPEPLAAEYAMAAYVATAFGGAVELTAAALIIMRRALGRLLYVGLLPLRIAIAGTATLLTYSAASATGGGTPQPDVRAALLGLGLDIALYAVLVVAMFRPVFTGWLTDAASSVSEPQREDPPPRNTSRRILAHPASRIGAFVVVLLLMVFVLDGPVELLWVGAAAVLLMLGVRAFLKRR